jgi:hypothetical protein
MLSRASRVRGGGPALLSILQFAAIAGGCGAAASSAAPAAPGGAPAGGGTSGSGGSAGTGGQGDPTKGNGNQGNGTQGNANGSAGNGTGNGAGGGEPQPAAYVAGQEGLQIIKTGTVQLQVADIDAGVTAASHAISQLGGYVSGSDRSGDGESARASVTFRIPAARWDEALAGIRGVGLKVVDERSSTDDVTTQVVDLAARIKNLESSEAAFQAIMDRAADIEDVLTVQDRLTTVRGQIEQLVAEKASLEGRAAYSTLTVTLTLKPTPVPVVAEAGFDPAGEAAAATTTLVGFLQSLATAGIWFGIVWLPILLGIGLLVAAGIVVTRRLSRAGPPIVPGAPSAS